MSTERAASTFSLIALAVIATACVSAPALAADVVFRPYLSFGVLHDGNVQVVGSGQGDDAAELAIELAVDRIAPQSKLTFAYRPSYRMYRTNRDLDYFGNAIVFNYTREPSRRTKTSVNFDATRSDRQGISDYSADRPVTFVPRTTTYRFAGDVGGSVGLARRSLFDWDVRLQSDRYSSTGTTSLQDSSSIGALGGWRYEATEKSTLGLALRLDWFIYAQNTTPPTSDIVSETLAFVGTQATRRSTELDYGAGASFSQSAGKTLTNPTFYFGVKSKRSETMTIDAGVRQAVGTGPGVGGGSLDRGAWIAFTRVPALRGLQASAYASYWFRRELEFDPQQPSAEVRTADVTGTVGWTFNRYVSLNAAYAFVDQQSPTSSAPNSDTNYSSYGVYVRWAIRGR